MARLIVESPTAVWTGTEMIIWGGVFDTTGASAGGKYNPARITGHRQALLMGLLVEKVTRLYGLALK